MFKTGFLLTLCFVLYFRWRQELNTRNYLEVYSKQLRHEMALTELEIALSEQSADA